MGQVLFETVKPVVLTSKQAAVYLGIISEHDVLRISRGTGLLWSQPAPKHIKAGTRKILYRIRDLDEFLESLGAG